MSGGSPVGGGMNGHEFMGVFKTALWFCDLCGASWDDCVISGAPCPKANPKEPEKDETEVKE